MDNRRIVGNRHPQDVPDFTAWAAAQDDLAEVPVFDARGRRQGTILIHRQPGGGAKVWYIARDEDATILSRGLGHIQPEN